MKKKTAPETETKNPPETAPETETAAALPVAEFLQMPEPTAAPPEYPPGFDPAVHQVDADGQPIIRPDGTFRRKPGRKPGAQPKPSIDGQPTRKVESAQLGNVRANPAELEKQYQMAAQVSAGLIFQIGMMIDAEEFAPVVRPDIGYNEKQVMEFAFANYYRQKGITDFPPGIGLAVAVGGYFLQRAQAPRTKSKLERFYSWLFKRDKK